MMAMRRNPIGIDRPHRNRTYQPACRAPVGVDPAQTAHQNRRNTPHFCGSHIAQAGITHGYPSAARDAHLDARRPDWRLRANEAGRPHTASIEDLMNIEITSVSHKEQRAGDAPAAVYVVTQEDIRRSGMTTGARAASAGARCAGCANQLEQVGGRDARIQQPVRREAAGADRRPHGLRPSQLRGLLGIARPPARPDRTH